MSSTVNQAVEIAVTDAKRMYDRWKREIYPQCDPNNTAQLLERFQETYPEFYKLFPVIGMYIAVELRFNRSAYQDIIQEYAEFTSSKDYHQCSTHDRDLKLIDLQTDYVVQIKIQEFTRAGHPKSNLNIDKMRADIYAHLVNEYRRTHEEHETMKQQIKKLNAQNREDNISDVVHELRQLNAAGAATSTVPPQSDNIKDRNATRLLMQSVIALVEHYWRDRYSHQVLDELAKKISTDPEGSVILEADGINEYAELIFKRDRRDKALAEQY